MRLAGVANPSLNVLRELPGLWIAGAAFEQCQFLFELFGFGLDMRQTGLALFGVNTVVSSVGVGDENAAKVIAQELLGGFCRTVGLEKVGRQVLITAIPNPVGDAIVAPGSFVGMGNGQRADFVEQIDVERQTATHGLALKSIGAGGNKLQAEEVGKELADFAVGDVELVTHINGGGFGRRSDIGTAKLARPGSMNIAVAVDAVYLLMNKTGDRHAWFQNNIFLNMLVDLGDRGEVRSLAQRAGIGCWN